MAYIILENDGVDITNIDGAVFNNFSSGNKSGIVGGYLNECALSATGNSIILSTGCLLLNGIRVKISEVESVVMSSTPSQDTRYQLIAQVIVDTAGKVAFELFAQSVQSLTQNAFLVDGMGTYQLEIGQFTHATLGTITDIVKTANVIYGASSIDINDIRNTAIQAKAVSTQAIATSNTAKAVSESAKVTADAAKDLALGVNEAVATEKGTVVTKDGNPVALFDADTKLDKGKETILVSDVFQSRITATNPIEILDSPLGLRTAEIKSIKGCSIKAIQKNGNFDGMAGWVLNNATATTSNGIATFTVTANSDCGIAADSSQQSLQSIAGHKYYISAWIKAKYARSVDFGFSNDPIQFTAVANQWVRLSVLVTPSISDDVLYLTHDCSAQYVIGDTFQIQDFRCIDLTESSQSLYNMTKEQLNVRLPNLPYFEGIRHTNITKLTSIGDNWADVDDFTENVNNAISNNRLLIDNIPIAGTVTITFDTEKISGATPQYITVGYGTETFNYIKDELFNQSAGKAKQSITIAITEEMIGCNLFIRYYSFTAPSTASYHISNIMLKHANNALTEYLPYKTDYVDIPQYTLRSLADGTADEITPTQYIQRLDINGNKLSEAIYTPITWDNKYSAWNYGMEKTVAGANGHGMALFTIKYPLDVVKQVETNTEMIHQLEKQIQALLGG